MQEKDTVSSVHFSKATSPAAEKNKCVRIKINKRINCIGSESNTLRVCVCVCIRERRRQQPQGVEFPPTTMIGRTTRLDGIERGGRERETGQLRRR